MVLAGKMRCFQKAQILGYETSYFLRKIFLDFVMTSNRQVFCLTLTQTYKGLASRCLVTLLVRLWRFWTQTPTFRVILKGLDQIAAQNVLRKVMYTSLMDRQVRWLALTQFMPLTPLFTQKPTALSVDLLKRYSSECFTEKTKESMWLIRWQPTSSLSTLKNWVMLHAIKMSIKLNRSSESTI